MTAMTWDAHPAFELRTVKRSGGASSSSLRLTGRGRAVVSVLAIALSGAAVLFGQSATADSAGDAVRVQHRTVASGETLWQIAGSVAEPGQDRREVVAALIDLNGLPGASLQAGQQILVPLND